MCARIPINHCSPTFTIFSHFSPSLLLFSFSSGGGGGSKGPSIVDKRGKELTCPLCDRIFKQSGRLNDHIKKQHAETVDDAATIDEGSSSASSSSTNAPPSNQSHTSTAPSSSSALPPPLPTKKQVVKISAPTAAAPIPSNITIMDIGSAGGYYDFKSPKLILHEWLLKEKAPRARYKTLPGPSGASSWLCKVVLPHHKQSEKDVVIFLSEKHAAENEDEAQQRGAVAALHHVAGDRSLERTLPPQYVALWRELCVLATERKQKEKEMTERRAVHQAQQQAALKKRGPSTVIMTEEKRKFVEDIIAEVRGGGDTYNSEGGGGGGDGWENFGRPETISKGAESTLEAAAVLLDEVMVLGFQEEDAVAAVTAVTSRNGSSGNGGVAELSSVLDWLCLNVAEHRLPSNFAPGAAGKPITHIFKALPKLKIAPSMIHITEGDQLPGMDEICNDPAVEELSQYGYPPHLAGDALKQSRGHTQEAVQILYCKLLGKEPVSLSATTTTTTDNDDESTNPADLEEWDEEKVALEAIFGGDVVFPSASWTSVTISVLLDGAAADAAASYCQRSKESLMMDGAALDLEFWAPRNKKYPEAVPVIAVRSEDLPPTCLLALTKQLGVAADKEMLGRPMVYEIACLVQEVLPQCLIETPSLANLFSSSTADDVDALDDGLDGDDDVDDGVEGLQTDDRIPNTEQQKQKERKKPRHQSRGFSTVSDLAAESARLLQHQREIQSSAKHAAMRAQRAKLPAFSQRAEVVEALLGAASTKVVVVSGATGCGKSTQVPQYILEEAITGGHGAACNIIVTQPRRISAVGLASRVASERGETVGKTVGYSVRLDSKQSRRTRLLFCTTGILLRRLLSDPVLMGTTCVVLDEVHERSIESDLLLLLLKNLLQSGVNSKLQVVLMSATADAQLFAGYFQGVPRNSTARILTIPGFTHPVVDLFLEDALEETGFVVGKPSKWARKDAGKKKKKTYNGINNSGFVSRGQDDAAAADDDIDVDVDVDDDGDDNDDAFTSQQQQQQQQYSRETLHSLRFIDETLVNYDLIEALVTRIASQSMLKKSTTAAQSPRPPNAILIFAPGADEIGRIVRALHSSPKLAAASPGGVRVLPLHGGLPPSQQTLVFERPPPGTLKIVVSTNVAETSITIDDVVCVIDTGRVKEMRFDAHRGIARLQETWVSQASAKQRRGRAGRVQPGVCYRLFSRASWGRMPVDTPPEVARAPLQSLVMDVKGILRDQEITVALSHMITPPDAVAVGAAVTALQRVGALDSTTGALTPLGQHLTRMPCDPRVGKMLIFGAMLRCLDPILTVAAVQGHGRPVFWSTPDRRDEAEAAKKALTAHIAVSKSDHLAAVAAYNGWRAALRRGNRSGASGYCTRNFISEQAMEAVHAGRRQYAEILVDLGFCSAEYPGDSSETGYNPGTAPLNSTSSGNTATTISNTTTSSASVMRHTGVGGVDQFAGHARIVKAVLAAGLYPQLLRVEHPAAKYQKVLGGAMEASGEAGKVRFFDRERGVFGVFNLFIYFMHLPFHRRRPRKLKKLIFFFAFFSIMIMYNRSCLPAPLLHQLLLWKIRIGVACILRPCANLQSFCSGGIHDSRVRCAAVWRGNQCAPQ